MFWLMTISIKINQYVKRWNHSTKKQPFLSRLIRSHFWSLWTQYDHKKTHQQQIQQTFIYYGLCRGFSHQMRILAELIQSVLPTTIPVLQLVKEAFEMIEYGRNFQAISGPMEKRNSNHYQATTVSEGAISKIIQNHSQLKLHLSCSIIWLCTIRSTDISSFDCILVWKQSDEQRRCVQNWTAKLADHQWWWGVCTPS